MPLIRRQRRLLVHVLSLALLFAQLGLSVHASTHFKSDLHGAPTSGHICGECTSFSPLQNMASGAAVVILPAIIVHDHALRSDATATVPSRAFNAFRSRAPPVL